MDVFCIVVIVSVFVKFCALDKVVAQYDRFMRPCYKEEEPLQSCWRPHDPCYRQFKLVKLDGVKRGHVRWIQLEEGKQYKMITRAMKPLVFEIPHFLSDQECEKIVELAKASGLTKSTAGNQSYEGDLDEALKTADASLGQDEDFAKDFTSWDLNRDGAIDVEEIKAFAAKHRQLYLKDDEVQDLLKRPGIAEYIWKGKMTTHAFHRFRVKKLLTYMDFLKTKSPRHRTRFSEQAWLRQDKTAVPILRNLHERIIKLTKLPREIVQGGEAMQVVRYQMFGHYHVHFDSGVDHPFLPCCHQNYYDKPVCKLCRFITILYYLNDVEQGGETAFPVADNITISGKELEDPSDVTKELFDVSINCHKSNLVIPPKKGTAVMWYNNFMDPDSGLLGALDMHSLHGGCDVIKGEKWIANNWLTAPTKYSQYIRSIYDSGFD